MTSRISQALLAPLCQELLKEGEARATRSSHQIPRASCRARQSHALRCYEKMHQERFEIEYIQKNTQGLLLYGLNLNENPMVLATPHGSENCGPICQR